MTDIFVERRFDPPLTGSSPPPLLSERCMTVCRIEWQESFVAKDRRRAVCRFRAPDLESMRIALRCGQATFEAVWAVDVLRPLAG